MSSTRKKITAASFMAVAAGSKSEESSKKLFKGIGAVEVLAVNPTREELNKIYKRQGGDGKEISYFSEVEAKDKDGNDIKVKSTRITLICKTDPKIACNNGIEAIIPVTFFIKQAFSFSNKNGVQKVQVIDPYGRTGWVTFEEHRAGAIPEYTIRKGERAGEKKLADISKGYHACYQGEEDLVKNVIAHVNIPSPTDWDENLHTRIMKTDPKELEQCECDLSYIGKDFFTEKIKSELKRIFELQPLNRYKLCFGVRTATNGTQYQCAYTRFPMKLNVFNYSSLEEELENDRKAGRHPSEEYGTIDENGKIKVSNLEEVKIGVTDYSTKRNETDEPDPFAAAAAQQASAPVDDLPPDTDPFAGM